MARTWLSAPLHAHSDFEIKWSIYLTARRAVLRRNPELEEYFQKKQKGLLAPTIYKPVNEAVYLESGRVMSLYLGMMDGRYTPKGKSSKKVSPEPASTPAESFTSGSMGESFKSTATTSTAA